MNKHCLLIVKITVITLGLHTIQSLSVTVSVTFCSVSGLCRLQRHITSCLLLKLQFLCPRAIRPAAWLPAFRPEILVHGRRQQHRPRRRIIRGPGFSCHNMLLQLLLWYYLVPTNRTHHPTRCRCRNAVHSGLWSVLTADMKPATVRLLDAYRPKSDAVCSRVLKYMIRTRMRQVIE